MPISHITGYKFITLRNLHSLQLVFMQHCQALQLKGTILLSKEGININLAGNTDSITAFKTILWSYDTFSDMALREHFSTKLSFKRLKIKLKNEIITLRCPDIQPEKQRVPSISPEQFKQWLDEQRDITVLDTRNEYEIQFGTFKHAVNLHINHFCEFLSAARHLTKEKPIVMFCTGGVRCEKAGLHLLNMGFSEVYQLEGGILHYFAKMGGSHYDGECFVFDERIALDSHLQCTNSIQCKMCLGPVKSPHTVCLTCSSHLPAI